MYNYTDERNSKLKGFYQDPDMEIDEQTLLSKPLTRIQLANDYEKKLLKWIVEAYKTLSGKTIDLEKFKDLVSVLEHLRQEQDRDYYRALITPEKTKGSKIPSPIPIPSASFQLKQSIWISTNTLGNLAIAFNPWGLFTTDRSTLYINNHTSLTGTSSNVNWQATRIGQQLPQAIYSKYRVVSSACAIRYVGRFDIVQGIIGGSVVFENVSEADPTVATVAADHPLSKYGDFNLAMDAFYTQENLTLHGTRGLYFPLDNSFEQYNIVGQSKPGFVNLFYISGGVNTSQAYKLDVCVNLECLPDSNFLNYMPIGCSTRGYDASKMQEAVKAVQKTPISKAESIDNPYAMEVYKPEQSLISSVSDMIGNIGSIIPGVKSLAGIVGSLIG